MSSLLNARVILWHPLRGLVSGVVSRELSTELIVDTGEETGFFRVPRPSAFVRVSALSCASNPSPCFLALLPPGGQKGQEGQEGQEGQIRKPRPLSLAEERALIGRGKSALARGEYLRAAYCTLAAGASLGELTEPELHALNATPAADRLRDTARAAIEDELQNGTLPE